MFCEVTGFIGMQHKQQLPYTSGESSKDCKFLLLVTYLLRELIYLPGTSLQSRPKLLSTMIKMGFINFPLSPTV